MSTSTEKHCAKCGAILYTYHYRMIGGVLLCDLCYGALLYGNPSGPKRTGTEDIFGWICPRCDKVNSPYVETCDCKKTKKNNYE